MTSPLFLDAAAIDRLASPADIVACVERSFRAISTGSARQPPRTLIKLERGGYGLMPGEVVDPPLFGIKLVSLFPDAPARGLSSHQGLVILHDGITGEPVLVADGARLTALRTAAASLVATRALMRPGPYTLGLVGCGEQAAAHLEIFRATLPPVRTLVWGRRPEAARAFAERHGDGVEAVASLEELVGAADVVCTLTKAVEPILLGRWLRPGQHVVAAGSSQPQKREIDEEVVARSAVFVDWREGAEREAGDIRAAIGSGRCGPEIVRGEIGEVLLGKVGGRAGAEEITLFKSLGVAAHDLLFAAWLREQAGPG